MLFRNFPLCEFKWSHLVWFKSPLCDFDCDLICISKINFFGPLRVSFHKGPEFLEPKFGKKLQKGQFLKFWKNLPREQCFLFAAEIRAYLGDHISLQTWLKTNPTGHMKLNLLTVPSSSLGTQTWNTWQSFSISA